MSFSAFSIVFSLAIKFSAIYFFSSLINYEKLLSGGPKVMGCGCHRQLLMVQNGFVPFHMPLSPLPLSVFLSLSQHGTQAGSDNQFFVYCPLFCGFLGPFLKQN